MNKKFYYALLMLVSLFAINANGAPMAYSVNSDSGNSSTEDSLYRIDLATGIDQQRGKLTRRDTEGLAFAPDGTLWGVDDDSLTLFPINTASGTINPLEELPLTGIPPAGGNDFGMTFSCDNSLYITSVTAQTLYKVDLSGSTAVAATVGTLGALGENISAIAAIGNPTKLYGLGNGQLANGTTDSPNLYSIDVNTGVATLIGPLGSDVDKYDQGGLAFNSDGTLWAITDRRTINNSKSQILRIDVNTGIASWVSSTINEVGFESLAIGPPTTCGLNQTNNNATPRIPTLSLAGRLLAIFVLMLAGMLILRRRIS